MIRVLLVEDGSYVAESLVAVLQSSEMEPVCCRSAEQALDAPPCDVVLADLRLPGISGVQLLHELKEREPALPVLILAGRQGTVRDAVEAMRAGALDFMTEPIEPDVIVERLRQAAERRRVEHDLNLRRRVRAFERQLFRDALRHAGGKKSDAARMLGIDPSNWAYHAKRLRLQ